MRRLVLRLLPGLLPLPALRIGRPLPVLALLAAAGVAAPAAHGVVAVDRPADHEVLVARDGAAARVVARDGAAPSLSAGGRVLAYVRTADGAVRLVQGRRRTIVALRDGRLRGAETVELSRDGRRLLVRDRDGWRLVHLASGRVLPVADDPQVTPRFSPDGTRVAWAASEGGAVTRSASDAGPPRRVFGPGARSVAWVREGLAVLHGPEGRREIAVVDPDTGTRRAAPAVPDAATADLLGPVFGGELLTLVRGGEAREARTVTVAHLDGTRLLRLAPRRGRILGDSTGWSSDGRTLYVVRGVDLVAVTLASGRERLVARRIGLEVSSAAR